MGTKYRLRDVNQLRGRRIFFDANVLIYLFWPTGQHAFEQQYAHVFKDLLKQGNELLVDFLIISEVINRILRIEYKKSNSKLQFKAFRNSKQGKKVLIDIYLIIKNGIFSRFNIIGKTFNKQDIMNFLVIDDLDFVDKATVELCKTNSLVLLTNDKDFKSTDLDILTGNSTIFTRRTKN